MSSPHVDTTEPATPAAIAVAEDAFVLHVAFASDSAQQSSGHGHGVSPSLQRARTYAPNHGSLANGSNSIGMVGVGELATPIALKYSPKTGTAPAPASISPPTLSPKLLAASAAPTSPVIAPASSSPRHQPPFGFLSFPTPSLPGVSASRVTLAQVRSILPTYFTAAHLASLSSAGVLSAASARALQTSSYYFICATSASGGVFSPVSPMQEEQILATACRPVLVLKAQRTQQATPHSHNTSSATPLGAGNTPGSGGSGGDSFLAKDYLIASAPNAGGRRPSFDFTHSVLSHQDTMTLLDSGVSRTAPHFGSPAPVPTQGRMLRGASHGPPALSPAEEEKIYGYGESDETDAAQQHDPAILMASPKLRALSGTNPSSEQIYRSLAEGFPVHFDDVIREKNAGHTLLSPPPHVRPAQLRITVTGELLDKPRRQDSRKDILRARRNTNIGDAAVAPDDQREGSVKLFTGVDEFLNDEERRRKKYDAASAAYAAAQVEDEISTDVSPSHGETRASPPPPSTRPATLPQTPLWISLEDGDDRAVEIIGRYFGLHPLTIEDCQSKGIREKLEVFPEYLFLVFHALEDANTPAAGKSASVFNLHASPIHIADPGAEIMRTTPLKLVVFPSLVLSFHKGGLPSVSVVRKQLDKLYSNRVLNTAWLIHGLLDVVSDSLMPVVDTAAKEADAMEDLIYIINPGRESHKDVLRRMGAIARRLTFLRQRLWSKRDILTSLIEKDWQFFLTGVKVPYLRDIYDHLVIMLHKLDAAIEVIVTLQSTYLAVVSIDVAAVSNDGNKAMKTLSASATILLPLSLIASLMGMNVMVPFNTGQDRITFRDLLPFSTICICMLFISTSLYSYFKKQKYL